MKKLGDVEEFQPNLLPEAIAAVAEFVHTPPETVFHYTSIDAAISIINNQCLWLSNINFLNDHQENSIIRNILSEIKSNPDDAASYMALSVAKMLFKYIESPPKSDTFVISFCKNGDLLSQWRGYGRLSIGFNAKEFQHNFEHMRLVKIIYDNVKQCNFVYSAIQKIASSAENGEEVIREFSLASSIFQVLSAHFKNAAFSEENEWRFIVDQFGMGRLGIRDVKFRARGNAIIPYIEIKPTSGRLPITSIRLAPGSHPTVKPALQWLLETMGYSDIDVLDSTIPYRE
jgi:hypothetical protein